MSPTRTGNFDTKNDGRSRNKEHFCRGLIVYQVETFSLFVGSGTANGTSSHNVDHCYCLNVAKRVRFVDEEEKHTYFEAKSIIKFLCLSPRPLITAD